MSGPTAAGREGPRTGTALRQNRPTLLASPQRLAGGLARHPFRSDGRVRSPLPALVGAVVILLQVGQPPPTGLPTARLGNPHAGQCQSARQHHSRVLARQQNIEPLSGPRWFTRAGTVAHYLCAT